MCFSLSLADLLTILAAWLGFLLGLYNTWVNYQRSKIKLQLSPAVSLKTDNGIFYSYCDGIDTIPSDVQPLFKKDGILSLRIVNMSEFPIYITSCGFAANKRLKPNRSPIRYLVFASGDKTGKSIRENGSVVLPLKLEKYEVIQLRIMDLHDRKNVQNLLRLGLVGVYAATSSGKTEWTNCEQLLKFMLS